MRLSIDAFGDEEMSRDLLRFDERARDMGPAWLLIQESFLGVEKHQFDSQGGYDGGWKPLAASTIAYKAKHGLDPRILHATGKLRSSLTTLSGDGHIYKPSSDEVVIGSNVAYGIYHQSRDPRHRLPRRPPVTLPDKTKRQWVKIIQSWIIEGDRSPVSGLDA